MPEMITDYTHRLQSLLAVCRSLSGQLELEPLLHAMIEASSSLTCSESSSILVFDKTNQALRFAAAPWFILEKMKLVNVPLEGSVAGWVFSNNQSYMIFHAENDERVNRVIDHELNFTTRSLLAVPMQFKGQVIGVLEAVNKANDSHYNEEDVFILETLASQAAIAIENRRLLEETQQAYQKAIELDRMKSDFIAIASHELRTPLGVILGHASFLEETATPEDREELEVIVRSALRLKEIIEDFSNIDHFERGLSRVRRGKVILQQIIQEVADGFRELAADRQVRLVIDFPEKHLIAEGEAGKIGIALRELVKNALVFTNPGGLVRVKGEVVPGFAKITVTDNGIGIPLEEQGKIFQRFYQVEKHLTRRHGGMGLGLSIAKDMIEIHGGRLWVESVEGKGSRFSFLLPTTAAQSSAAERVFIT
jgi:signal transduction histidine kinase